MTLRMTKTSFNGEPQALLMDFAYVCGSPLNEYDRYTIAQQPVTPSALDLSARWA